jgi:hypothetical protein
MEDKVPKVQAKALETTVMMFENVLNNEYKNEMLASIDYKVFDNYILPAISRLQRSSKNQLIVQVTYTTNLPLIAKIGNYFSELSLSSQINQQRQEKKDAVDLLESQINPALKRQSLLDKDAPAANN